MRVVSLVPAATDVLCALGPDAAPVGVTDECRAPEGTPVVVASVLPAGLSQAEIDTVVASRVARGLPLREVRTQLLQLLAPDVVVAQDLCAVCAVGAEDVGRALEMVGSPAVVHRYDPRRLAELVPAVRALTAASGLGARGAALADDLQRRLDDLAAAAGGRPRPRVAVLEWTDPVWSAGHWVPDVVAAAGGVEVLGTAGAPSARLSRDDVLAARPAVVVVAPCGLALAPAVVAAREVASWLPGDVRVLAADGTVLTGAGPGLVDVAEALAALLDAGTADAPVPGSSVVEVRSGGGGSHPGVTIN